MTYREMTIKLLLFVAVCVGYATDSAAQFTHRWTSPSVLSDEVSGWLQYRESAGSWDYRFYTLTATQFSVKSGPLSPTNERTYTFSAPEIAAGNSIYSLQLDLTGDGVTEFYVLAWYGSATPYRQSYRIFDIVTGSTVFERNDPGFDYSYPVIWDIDENGEWDCTFTKTSFPNGTNYVYEVFATGVYSSTGISRPVALNSELKQNFPNPFNPSTTIPLDLERPAVVQLDIVNVLGQHVVALANEPRNPGRNVWTWDGKDTHGVGQASGAYYAVAKVDGRPLPPRTLMLTR